MKSTTTSTALFRNPITSAVLALFSAACPVQAVQVLVDGGFESNPLIADSAVRFGGTVNFWGQESATISTGNSGVTPFSGTKMLHTTGSANAWQTAQITDVTGYSGDIDAGGQPYDLKAMFTTGAAVSGKTGQVIISFYTGNSPGGPTGFLSSFSSALVLAGDTTWEQIQNTGTIPVGTRYILSDLAFRNDAGAMGGNPGFVDAASLDIVPEPSSMTLLALGATSLLLRRRRQGRA